MAEREKALEKFYEWEREDVEYHYFYLPKFLRKIILNTRMKIVERRLDAGKLNSYL